MDRRDQLKSNEPSIQSNHIIAKRKLLYSITHRHKFKFQNIQDSSSDDEQVHQLQNRTALLIDCGRIQRPTLGGLPRQEHEIEAHLISNKKRRHWVGVRNTQWHIEAIRVPLLTWWQEHAKWACTTTTSTHCHYHNCEDGFHHHTGQSETRVIAQAAYFKATSNLCV